MNTRHGQRREHPYLAIVDEQVGTGAPVHFVAVKTNEALHVLLGETFGSVFEGRLGGVVEDEEGRAPGVPLERVAIGVEFGWGKGEADDRFPVWHTRGLMIYNGTSNISGYLLYLTPAFIEIINNVKLFFPLSGLYFIFFVN